MEWSGTFHLGDTWAAYAGPSDQNALHAHVAVQIVLALHTAAHMRSGAEGRVSTVAPWQGLVVRPLVEHELAPAKLVWLLYLEPASPLALALLHAIGAAGIERLPDPLAELASGVQTPAEWLLLLQEKLLPATGVVDSRLLRALDALRAEPGSMSVAGAASLCGLSPSRLRSLAQQQLGVPLATWVLWRKVDRAVRALAAGQPLAEAALTGGFADQAHFTRTMRRMFGVTPSVATSSLRKPGS